VYIGEKVHFEFLGGGGDSVKKKNKGIYYDRRFERFLLVHNKCISSS